MTYLKNLAVLSLAENKALCLVVVCYLAVVSAVGAIYGFEISLRLYRAEWLHATALAFVPWLLLATVWHLALHRPRRPFQFIGNLYVRRWQLPERLAVALPVFLVFPPMFSAYSSLKHSIHVLNPTLIDAALIRLDDALHGGPAWHVAYPFIATPLAAKTIDAAYLLWFFVWYVFLSAAAVSIGQPRLRKQFLLSFAVCWTLLGGAGAVLFASVGPCYLPVFLAQESAPFAPLMAHLNEMAATHEIFALKIQNALLETYREAAPGLGYGISAMPSLHVALAALVAILGWKRSRILGLLATLYAVLVQIGSVALGWHYAVDGYAGVIAVLAIWKLVGWSLDGSPSAWRRGHLAGPRAEEAGHAATPPAE